MEIKVVKQIMEWNENCHKELQDELKEKKVFMINIMGSPGAGKTTFILGLIDELKKSGINSNINVVFHAPGERIMLIINILLSFNLS